MWGLTSWPPRSSHMFYWQGQPGIPLPSGPTSRENDLLQYEWPCASTSHTKDCPICHLQGQPKDSLRHFKELEWLLSVALSLAEMARPLYPWINVDTGSPGRGITTSGNGDIPWRGWQLKAACCHCPQQLRQPICHRGRSRWPTHSPPQTHRPVERYSQVHRKS